MHVTQNRSQTSRGVSQMQKLAAIILCIATQAAFAQCVAPDAANTAAAPAQSATTTVSATPSKPGARPGPELIKTAAASTRDDAPPAARSATHTPDGDDHPRRGGTAMLLAALALMSGIALRRYGANNT
jgi:hypothetical protein